jgi:tRNA(fMet)-specific endonuclease VapC
MRRYVLDTGIAADFIYHRRGVAERVSREVATGNRVGVAMPTVGELFAGVENSGSRDKNRVMLSRALIQLAQWPFDRAAAEEFGRIYAHLKRSGRLIQQIDIQIAAVAICLGNCTVVTKDSDFAAVPGLSFENWATL